MENFNKRKKINLVELFGGIGSQLQAIKNLGYKVNSKLVEIDEKTVDMYNLLHGTKEKPIDITTLQASQLPNDIDILTYSFPCQDLTTAGQLKGINNNTRSGLVSHVFRLLNDIEYAKRPKILLMENVKNLVSKRFSEDYRYKILKELSDLGYMNYTLILNARHIGIPQSRERVFCVSLLSRWYYNINEFYDNEDYFNNVLPLPSLNDFLDFDYNEETLQAQIKDIKKNKEYYKASKILNTSKYCNTIITKQLTRRNAGLVKISKPLEGNLPIRTLTPRECFRLMGWKDKDYDKLHGKFGKTLLYKAAGNSIVVNVLEYIFRFILTRGECARQ